MRIATFIDYWNFQLILNQKIGAHTKEGRHRTRVDWRNLGRRLALAARDTVYADDRAWEFEGCHIYTSFDPETDDGKKFRKWVTTWLNRQPGNNVEMRERRPRPAPRCPACHASVAHCPNSACGQPMGGMTEKAVDMLLATDLIRFAVDDFYDIAVLASLDEDMVPAVRFVQSLGKKVIQSGFPPGGVTLSAECWASFDVMTIVDEIIETP